MKLRLKRRSICVLCAVSKETSGFICRQFVSMGSVRCRRQEATRRPSAVSSAHNRCGAEGERVFKVGTNTTCASALSLPACCKPKINKALLVLLTNSAQRTKEYSKRPPIFPKGGQIYAAAAAHSFHFTVLQRSPHSKYKKDARSTSHFRAPLTCHSASYHDLRTQVFSLFYCHAHVI